METPVLLASTIPWVITAEIRDLMEVVTEVIFLMVLEGLTGELVMAAHWGLTGVFTAAIFLTLVLTEAVGLTVVELGTVQPLLTAVTVVIVLMEVDITEDLEMVGLVTEVYTVLEGFTELEVGTMAVALDLTEDTVLEELTELEEASTEVMLDLTEWTMMAIMGTDQQASIIMVVLDTVQLPVVRQIMVDRHPNRVTPTVTPLPIHKFRCTVMSRDMALHKPLDGKRNTHNLAKIYLEKEKLIFL